MWYVLDAGAVCFFLLLGEAVDPIRTSPISSHLIMSSISSSNSLIEQEVCNLVIATAVFTNGSSHSRRRLRGRIRSRDGSSRRRLLARMTAPSTVDLAPAAFIVGLAVVDVVVDVAVRVLVSLVLLQRRSKHLWVLLPARLGDVLAANAADDRVVQTNPLATILSAIIHGVMPAACVLAVVVDDPHEPVLREAALSHHDVASVRREDLSRNLEVEGVSDLLPDFLRSSRHAVVLETFEVEDQNGW